MSDTITGNMLIDHLVVLSDTASFFFSLKYVFFQTKKPTKFQPKKNKKNEINFVLKDIVIKCECLIVLRLLLLLISLQLKNLFYKGYNCLKTSN